MTCLHKTNSRIQGQKRHILRPIKTIEYCQDSCRLPSHFQTAKKIENCKTIVDCPDNQSDQSVSQSCVCHIKPGRTKTNKNYIFSRIE